MNNYEFEQFVREHGEAILRFCRMTAGNEDLGNDLYQDTMLKLLEKREKLDFGKNVKSYALSISILLWRNKKKKYAVRGKIASIRSLEAYREENEQFEPVSEDKTPEQAVLAANEIKFVQELVASLPEKYRLPLYLNYSADLKMEEIADCLQIPEGTVKTRIRKAKHLLKKQLEAIEYDR
jgi:RNA polymerase sigma-70 factor (ECF subfamily)